jgi:putative oxidoreductase
MANSLARTQRDIGAALHDVTAAGQATRWLAGDNALGLRRLALYRSNVDAAAAKALAAAHPVIRQLVGDEFFDALASAYRREHPSRYGDLNEFGESLADFLGPFPPAQSLPYLPDLARLEWAAHRAYGAADAERLDHAALAAVSPEKQAALSFRFAPGTAVIRSTHPVARIWAVHQPADDRAFEVDLSMAETALVTRSGYRVVVMAIGAGDAAFIDRALRDRVRLDLRLLHSTDNESFMNALIQRARVITGLIDRYLQPLLLLAARLYVANVFIKSGLVKLSDWSATLALFHDEYKVPLLPPDLAAYVGTFGELFFPVLIVLGLAGRFGAAGLFVVNAMAVASYPQLFGFDCPAAINSHAYWGSLLLSLVVFGPGKLSLDAVILRRLGFPARSTLSPAMS